MKGDAPDPVLYYRMELRKLRDSIARQRDETSTPFDEIVDHVEHELDTILANAPLGDGTVPVADKHASGRNEWVEEITRITSLQMGVPVPAINGPRRTKTIAHARHIAMFLVNERTTLTLAEIGRYFGGRDHSSVQHAVQKVRRNMFTNKDNVCRDVADIRTLLDSRTEALA